MSATWPDLPYAPWKDTCATLQLWTQIVGKVRLALTPWLNHSWHVTLRVTARGLATPLISDSTHDFQVEFDFLDVAGILEILALPDILKSSLERMVAVCKGNVVVKLPLCCVEDLKQVTVAEIGVRGAAT